MSNCNLLLWSKLNFQHHYSSLQCHVIFSNHSNMLICCTRNIYDYYQCWKQVRWSIVLWKPWYILFFRIHKMNRKFTEQHLFEIVILYISLLSLLINLMHHLWIKVFISFHNNHTDPKWYLLDSMISCMLLFCAVFSCGRWPVRTDLRPVLCLYQSAVTNTGHDSVFHEKRLKLKTRAPVFFLWWERELVAPDAGGFAPCLLLYFTGHFRANEMRLLSRKQSDLLGLTLHSSRRLIPSNTLRALLRAHKLQIADISDRYKDKMNTPTCKIIHKKSTCCLLKWPAGP